MQRCRILGVTLLAFVLSPTFLLSAPFELTYQFDGGFNIHGHQPVPQVNGFDYYFTPLALDTSLIGEGVTISSITVSGFGLNSGAVINWDWEVFLGPDPFGLPEGQFTQTHIDPVSGYARTAPTQLNFVIGSRADTQSYDFSGEYNFDTGAISATPYLSTLKTAFTSEMNLTDGLYAQLFLWTADNRNVQIEFSELTLTVLGDIANPVPEPTTICLLALGVARAGLVARRRR